MSTYQYSRWKRDLRYPIIDEHKILIDRPTTFKQDVSFSFTLPEQLRPCPFSKTLDEDADFSVVSISLPPNIPEPRPVSSHGVHKGRPHSLIRYEIYVRGRWRLKPQEPLLPFNTWRRPLNIHPFRTDPLPELGLLSQTMQIQCEVPALTSRRKYLFDSFDSRRRCRFSMTLTTFWPLTVCAGEILTLLMELIPGQNILTIRKTPEVRLNRVEIDLGFLTISRLKPGDMADVTDDGRPATERNWASENLMDRKLNLPIPLPIRRIIPPAGKS